MEEFFETFVSEIKRWSDYESRSSLRQYWSFTGVNIVISIILSVAGGAGGVLGLGAILPIASGLFSLLMLVPSITVAIRRMHDIDKSGWYLLICLIPLVGWLVVLYFMFQPGTVGANKFGADPKIPQAQIS